MRVELQYFEGCPHWRSANEMLRALQPQYGFRLELVDVDDVETARLLGFRGSPTILIDGVDPFGGAPAGGLACRMFITPDGPAGVPTESQLHAALSRGR